MLFSVIIILLSAHILTVSNGQSVPALATCDKGKLLQGKFHANYNISNI